MPNEDRWLQIKLERETFNTLDELIPSKMKGRFFSAIVMNIIDALKEDDTLVWDTVAGRTKFVAGKVEK